MKIYLFIYLLIPVSVFSQDIEKIKNADTIYICFKRDKNQFSTTNNSINLNNLSYYYSNFGVINPKSSYMTFMHHYSLSPEERTEKKSFLKKNRDLIITYDFLTKHSLSEATELIGHKKKVYLIDYDKIGWFSIKLKEVKVVGVLKPSIE
jgi:hypothetical protein